MGYKPRMGDVSPTFEVYKNNRLATGLKRFPNNVQSILITLKLAKAVFHFNRIVAKLAVFDCVVSTQEELMIWTK